MNSYEFTEALEKLIKGVCPYCSTTSTGSTVTVSATDDSDSNSSNQIKVESDESSNAEYVAEYCERLVDEQGDEDDVAVYDRYGDEKLAVCYDD